MSQPTEPQKGFSFKHLLAAAAAAMLLTIVAGAVVVVVKNWLFPQPFSPTVLDGKEQAQLEQKLDRLTNVSSAPALPARQQLDQGSPEQSAVQQQPAPEPYSERAADREVAFSEREINSLLASNPDLAQKMAVDFADSLVSLHLLLPLDPDFPIMGGKTLRIKAGAELAFRSGRPIVVLKGISLMGVPLPNAWLGGLKNVDLMQEFGGEPGFWKSFGDGVENLQVNEGELRVRLRE